MEQLLELAPALSNLALIVLIFGLVIYWAYKLATYNWQDFEEDSKDDDFLKPYDQ